MSCPCEYTAKIWNEIEEKEEICHGIAFGDSFADAMFEIESYYKDTLIWVTLSLLESNGCKVYEFENDNSTSELFNLQITDKIAISR